MEHASYSSCFLCGRAIKNSELSTTAVAPDGDGTAPVHVSCLEDQRRSEMPGNSPGNLPMDAITMRDFIATKSLAGLRASPKIDEIIDDYRDPSLFSDSDVLARIAYMDADAMIRERKNPSN